MEAGLVDALGRDEARAAHELRSDRDTRQRVLSGNMFALGEREDGRNDDGAGMDGTAFEGVVEVFAVRGGAVHERCASGIERTRVAERRAAAGRFPALQ